MLMYNYHIVTYLINNQHYFFGRYNSKIRSLFSRLNVRKYMQINFWIQNLYKQNIIKKKKNHFRKKNHPNCRCCSIGTRQYRLHKNVVDLSAMVLLCILLLNILHIKQQQLVSQQYKFGRCLLSRKGRGAVVFLPRVATLSCRLRRVGIVHLVQ